MTIRRARDTRGIVHLWWRTYRDEIVPWCGWDDGARGKVRHTLPGAIITSDSTPITCDDCRIKARPRPRGRSMAPQVIEGPDALVQAAKRAFMVFQEWDNEDPMPFDSLDADGQFAWERIAAAAVSGYMETVAKGIKASRMRDGL